LGRFSDAIEQLRLALDADPISVVFYHGMANALYDAKQYGPSMEFARKGLEIDAHFPYNWWALGMAQLREGLVHKAIASFQRVVELMPWHGAYAWWLATAYHQAGDRERRDALAHSLAELHGHTYLAALYHASTGEGDKMLDALEASYREREAILFYVKNEAFFDSYRAEPRLQALLAKMNLA